MFFVASKILWLLVAPSHLLLWCALAGVFCLWRGRRRAATIFVALTALLLVGIGAVPSYIWLGQQMEHQYDRVPLPAHADAILVLAGGDGADLRRLVTAMALARRYPEARIVFSGGDAALVNNRPDVESRRARELLTRMGIDPARVVLEGKSRNTSENFLFTRQIVKPAPSQVWILVTSAYHMPRALEIARRLDWNFVPRPSDHLTPAQGTKGWLDIPENLQAFDTIVHEGIGLVAYRWSGRSSAT